MRTRAKRARDEEDAHTVVTIPDEASNDGLQLTQQQQQHQHHPNMSQAAGGGGGGGGKFVVGFTPAIVSHILAQCCRMLEGAFRTDFSSSKVLKETDIHTAVQSPYNLLFHYNPGHAAIYKKLQSSISLSSSLGHRSCHCLWGSEGSGKRRLLALVGASLSTKKNYIVLHFDGNVVQGDDDAVRSIVSAVRAFMLSDAASRDLRRRHAALLQLGLDPTLSGLVELGEWYEEYTMLEESYKSMSSGGGRKKHYEVHRREVDDDATTMEGVSVILQNEAQQRAAREELMRFRSRQSLCRHSSLLYKHARKYMHHHQNTSSSTNLQDSHQHLSATALDTLRQAADRPEEDPLGDGVGGGGGGDGGGEEMDPAPPVSDIGGGLGEEGDEFGSDAEGTNSDDDDEGEMLAQNTQKLHQASTSAGPASSSLSRALSRLQSALLYFNSLGVNLIVLIDNMSRFGRVADRVTYILSGLMHEQRQQASFSLSAKVDAGGKGGIVADDDDDEDTATGGVCFLVTSATPEVTLEKRLSSRLSCEMWLCPPLVFPPLTALSHLFDASSMPAELTEPATPSTGTIPSKRTTPTPISALAALCDHHSGWPIGVPASVPSLLVPSMVFPQGCYPQPDSHLTASPACNTSYRQLATSNVLASLHWRLSLLEAEYIRLYEYTEVSKQYAEEMMKPLKQKVETSAAPKLSAKGGRKKGPPVSQRLSMKELIDRMPRRSFKELYDAGALSPALCPQLALLMDTLRHQLSVAELLSMSMFRNFHGESAIPQPSPRATMLLGAHQYCANLLAEQHSSSDNNNTNHINDNAATPSEYYQSLVPVFCSWDVRSVKRVRESVKPFLQGIMQSSMLHRVVGSNVDTSRWVLSDALTGGLLNVLDSRLDKTSFSVGGGGHPPLQLTQLTQHQQSQSSPQQHHQQPLHATNSIRIGKRLVPLAPAGLALVRAMQAGNNTTSAACHTNSHVGAFASVGAAATGGGSSFLPMTVQGSTQGGTRDALDSAVLTRNGFLGVEHILILATLYVRLDSGQQRSVTDLIDDVRISYYPNAPGGGAAATSSSSVVAPTTTAATSSRTTAAIYAALSQLLSWHIVGIYKSGGGAGGIGAIGLKQGSTGAKHAVGDVVVLGPLSRLHGFLRDIVDSPGLCALAGIDARRQGQLSSTIR